MIPTTHSDRGTLLIMDSNPLSDVTKLTIPKVLKLQFQLMVQPWPKGKVVSEDHTTEEEREEEEEGGGGGGGGRGGGGTVEYLEQNYSHTNVA